MCVVLQQPVPVVKETPREVILRAYATGLLDGIGPNHLKETMRPNHPSMLKKQPCVAGSESGPVVPTQAKPPKTKSSWGVTRGLHLMSHTKASQGENHHFRVYQFSQLKAGLFISKVFLIFLCCCWNARIPPLWDKSTTVILF